MEHSPTSATGTAWEPTPWRATQRAGRDALTRAIEGLVAKEETSLYEPGPTRRWLKVKQHGWTDAEDRWQRRISARVQR